MNEWALLNKVYLCWEMFPRTRGEWLKTPFELYELATTYRNFKITFDTSHVDDKYWLHPLTWDFIKSKVGILHFSVKPKTPIFTGFSEMTNEKNLKKNYIREHCPIDYEDPEYNNLEFLKMIIKSGWNKEIYLEYMPRYDEKIKKDVQKITNIINEK